MAATGGSKGTVGSRCVTTKPPAPEQLGPEAMSESAQADLRNDATEAPFSDAPSG